MILILGAMDCEVESVKGAMENLVRKPWSGGEIFLGRLFGREVVLSVSGVGKVRAALSTQYLIDQFAPECLVFTGLAGALNPAFEQGDVLVARDLVQYDVDARVMGFARGEIPWSGRQFVETDPALCKFLETWQPESGRLFFGRVGTGDTFMTARYLESHRYLQEELKIEAVEMEGAAVAEVCNLNRLPCLIVRTISDKADGSAKTAFQDFLPKASINALALLKHVFAQAISG